MKSVMVLILCSLLVVSGAMAADVGEGAGDSPLKAVHAYLKEVELIRVVVSYSSGSNDAFNESQGKKFKEAVVAAGNNEKLVDALKAVRGAEIAVLEHSSPANRASLDKSVGAAKVELELVE